MSTEHAGRFRNKVLLALLKHDNTQRIRQELEYVDLDQGTVLGKRGDPIKHIYFPETFVASIVVETPKGLRAEAAVVGFENISPPCVVSGSPRYFREVQVQIAGSANRIPIETFQHIRSASQPFADELLFAFARYADQLSSTAASNAVHDVTQRLARWILMCHDRVLSDELLITHEFISTMLCVRRATVTTSLHVLEGQGFIKSERKTLTVRDRRALEIFAEDAYGDPDRA